MGPASVDLSPPSDARKCIELVRIGAWGTYVDWQVHTSNRARRWIQGPMRFNWGVGRDLFPSLARLLHQHFVIRRRCPTLACHPSVSQRTCSALSCQRMPTAAVRHPPLRPLLERVRFVPSGKPVLRWRAHKKTILQIWARFSFFAHFRKWQPV